MNLNKNDSELEGILFQYFRKELSSAEREEVEDWRKLEPDNQDLFDEYRLLFLDMKGLTYYRKLETPADQSWDRFTKDHKIAPQRKLIPMSTVLRIAASIIVVLSAVVFVMQYQTQPTAMILADLTAVETVQLQDGSDITLNEGAVLTYTEPFQNNERRVRLEGNGFFDIAKDPEKPFVVQAQEAEVRVLGTQFYINQSEDLVDLKVEEGKVLISFNDQHEIVEAGESLSINLKQKLFSVPGTDKTGLDTFWKTRRLVFDLTTIEEVIATVNQAYGSTLQVEGSTEACALTVIFENESFENVLEIISNTLGYEVIEEQDAIILRGNGCD